MIKVNQGREKCNGFKEGDDMDDKIDKEEIADNDKEMDDNVGGKEDYDDNGEKEDIDDKWNKKDMDDNTDKDDNGDVK